MSLILFRMRPIFCSEIKHRYAPFHNITPGYGMIAAVGEWRAAAAVSSYFCIKRLQGIHAWNNGRFGPTTVFPHESTQANRIKPFNRIKGRTSLVTLQRSPLRGLRVPILVQIPETPFYSVRLCGLVWSAGVRGLVSQKGALHESVIVCRSINFRCFNKPPAMINVLTDVEVLPRRGGRTTG